MLTCRKTQVRESAAQWNLDALLETPGGDMLPCFVAVLTSYSTVQVPNTKDGEAIFGDVARALGAPPSTPPQAVKGGSCGGEEEDEEFAFTGSMISTTWEFPKERRGAVLASIRGLFGLTDGSSG
jgi:hypothetical protein